LAARLADGRLADLRFDGKGCVISQASASMMTEALQGMTVDDARALLTRFIAVMRGEEDFDADMPEDVPALSGVRKFPLRVKCATMSWHGMEKVLAKLDTPSA